MYDQGRTKWRSRRLAHTARSDTIFSHTVCEPNNSIQKRNQTKFILARLLYLVACEVNLIEVLEIMAQMGQCYIYYILTETNLGDFRHYFDPFEQKL